MLFILFLFFLLAFSVAIIIIIANSRINNRLLLSLLVIGFSIWAARCYAILLTGIFLSFNRYIMAPSHTALSAYPKDALLPFIVMSTYTGILLVSTRNSCHKALKWSLTIITYLLSVSSLIYLLHLL